MKGKYTMISRCLNILKTQKSCVTFSPAEDKNINLINTMLADNGFSELPDEYKVFLKLSDGFIYNGLELYGTTTHNRKEKGYVFPDLASIAKTYADYDFFRNKTVLGRISESIIFYDKQSDSYAVADRINLLSRAEYPTFSDIMQIYMEKEDVT